MLEQQIEADIKSALLSGDKDRALALRTIKSTLLSAKVNNGTRDEAMKDDDVIAILAKESKKRQESADFFMQGGAQDRADKELFEKAIIDNYLPQQLSEDEVKALVTEAIAAQPGAPMGAIIGAVRGKAGASADGGLIARLVKEAL